MNTLTIQILVPHSDKDPFEFNTVPSTNSSKSSTRNQKKGQGKKNHNNARYRKKSNFPTNNSPNCKPKFPCLMCGKDHFTKDCPHRKDVNHFFKGNIPPPTILTNPLPNQANQVESQDQNSGFGSSQVLMC